MQQVANKKTGYKYNGYNQEKCPDNKTEFCEFFLHDKYFQKKIKFKRIVIATSRIPKGTTRKYHFCS